MRLLTALLLGVVGFFGGGFFARFFLISDNTGFEGATTAALSALGGAVAGIVIGLTLRRRPGKD